MSERTQMQVIVLVLADICRELNGERLDREMYDKELKVRTKIRLGREVSLEQLEAVTKDET